MMYLSWSSSDSGRTSAGGALVSGSLTRYDPFGNFRITPTTNPGVSDRGFTGHRQNNTGANGLGLIYMNARYYLPEIGRFISADTIVPEPSNPQSYNRYAYGYNNPVKYSDPTGHLSEDEIEAYFGFRNRQEMFDAGWVEELVNWLWDPDVTWGDVFSYNDGAGEAMLALLEEHQQDSGLYRGIFWGLNGEDKGEEVYRSQIKSLDDHTQVATALEEFYQDHWENLPKQTGRDGYNNYDPTTYVDALTVGTVSASVSIGGLFLISGPGGWVAAGVSVISGGTAIYQVATDNLTATYPVLRLPSPLGNAPHTWHAFTPRGFYE